MWQVRDLWPVMRQRVGLIVLAVEGVLALLLIAGLARAWSSGPDEERQRGAAAPPPAAAVSGFELRTVRSRAGLCVSGRDLFSGRTTKLRCVERLDDDVVIWPARNRRAGVTYYYGLARKDVRRVEITSRSGMRTSAPTLVLKTPAGQPKVRLVLVRVPGHRVARSVRAQA